MKKIIHFLLNKLFIVSVLCAAFIAQAELKFVEPLVLIDDLADHVKRVEDANKAQFIAKFHSHAGQAIAEALSAQIGIDTGLNINEVQFIDIAKNIADSVPNDQNTKLFTTLHSIVPGQEVYCQDINDTVSIRGGLMRNTNFRSLLAFKTLCPIVALDIFTDNYDRHNGNLFFENVSQQFYAIDMDYAFCKITGAPLFFMPLDQRDSMALNVYAFLKEYQGSEKKLSEDERDALQRIKCILEKMIALYSPKKLYDAWMKLALRINRQYTPREKIAIAKILTKQYYTSILLHAQLTILTNTLSREYSSEAIVALAEKMIECQSRYRTMHTVLSEKYDIMRTNIAQTAERLGLPNLLAKYRSLRSRLSQAIS